MTIRVVVADDHRIWRSGIRADLGDGFDVVGEAADAAGAIAAIDEHDPDVVLCDLHMPGGGFKVAAARGSAVPIIMVTVSEAERDVLDAVAAGASGYLVKSVGVDELRAAVRDAVAGQAVFTPGLAALVLGEFRRLSGQVTPASALTEREREVLGLVARGLTYRVVGEQLFISPKTVENHVRKILDKLHLSRRDELIRYAAEHGID
ncbi:MAG: response regulator transcription factor [Actinomycetota bacterium]